MNGPRASDFKIPTPEWERSSGEMSFETGVSTVMVATIDRDIRNSLTGLLQVHPVKTVWAQSVEGVRSALAKENVSACFCGFWLLDGTYRDVIRYLRDRATEIPAIIACAPACPHEYQDYFAALNIRAFDFMSFPYSASHLELVLRSALRAPRRLRAKAVIPTNRLERFVGSK